MRGYLSALFIDKHICCTIPIAFPLDFVEKDCLMLHVFMLLWPNCFMQAFAGLYTSFPGSFDVPLISVCRKFKITLLIYQIINNLLYRQVRGHSITFFYFVNVNEPRWYLIFKDAPFWTFLQFVKHMMTHSSFLRLAINCIEIQSTSSCQYTECPLKRSLASVSKII